MNKDSGIKTLVTTLALSAIASHAVAERHFSESFDYAPGSTIVGQNGGSGFAAAWSAGGNFNNDFVTNGGLPLAGHAGVGNALSSTSQTQASPWRELDNVYGASGTTQWASFLIRQDQPAPSSPNQFGGIVFGNLFVGTGAGFSTWGMNTAGSPTGVESGVPVVQGETVHLVIKLTYQPGNDIVELFVNPAAGVEPTVAQATKTDLNVTFNAIGFGHRDSNWTIDEIRYGDTYADVIPEPNSLALMALGGILARRRRR
ncbi:MAG: PEP-CTERM sorting domain-containing protein [Planctomycetota bacterium]